MYEIKEIRIWPFARSLALILTSIVTICSVIFPLMISLMMTLTSPYYSPGDLADEILGNPEAIGFFIAIILGTFIASLVGGMFGAWIYNLVSQKLGGIKMQIVLDEEE